MNSKEINIEDRTYFAIYGDFTFEEIADLRSSKLLPSKPLFLVEKIFYSKTKSLFNDDYFLHYSYNMVDTDLERFQYIQNGWTLLSVTEPPNDRNSTVFYKISSPDGIVRNISNIMIDENRKYHYYRVEGLCHALMYFQEFFKYPDWGYYDVKLENEKYRKENEKIKRRLELQNRMLIENNLKPINF